MIVFGELGFDQESLVTMRYGDRFRVHRKLTHMGMGLQQVRNYQHIQSNENKVVLLDLLRDPDHFVDHLERYAASVVSTIGFGRRIQNPDDPIITEVIRIMQHAAELNVPGKSLPMLMETFPILAKFPDRIAPWKKGLGRGRNFFYALAEEAAESTNEAQRDCYAKKLFAEAPKYGLSELEQATLAGALFGAGSDTSSSTLITFILACVAFPDTLPPAWEELDRVVGRERSPTFTDEPNLPYVKAFVKEVLRWRSVAIIGGQPHAPIQDEYYKVSPLPFFPRAKCQKLSPLYTPRSLTLPLTYAQGYLIPKSTWTQGNVWAIHHHTREFPDPDTFNPRRFLKHDPASRPFPNDRGYMTFGWGRRVCVGQALAEQGTWISVARMLWGFRFAHALDPHTRREVPVDIFDYTDGLNMRPNPFRARIEVRCDQIRDTIEREGNQALRDLAVYNGTTKYRMSTYYQQSKL